MTSKRHTPCARLLARMPVLHPDRPRKRSLLVGEPGATCRDCGSVSLQATRCCVWGLPSVAGPRVPSKMACAKRSLPTKPGEKGAMVGGRGARALRHYGPRRRVRKGTAWPIAPQRAIAACDSVEAPSTRPQLKWSSWSAPSWPASSDCVKFRKCAGLWHS